MTTHVGFQYRSVIGILFIAGVFLMPVLPGNASATGTTTLTPPSHPVALVSISQPPLPQQVTPLVPQPLAGGTSSWAELCTPAAFGGHCVPQPSARQGASTVWDPLDEYMVLFGGSTAVLSGFLNDTWTWTNGGATQGQWTLLTTPVAPPKMSNASMVWDSSDGYVLLTGGYTGANQFSSQTWSFLGGVWTKVSPAPPAFSGRAGACAMMIPSIAGTGGYVLVAGGSNRTGALTAPKVLNDTWEYSGGVWTNVTTLVGVRPNARTLAGCAYNVANSYGLLFGGITSANVLLNDTWKFAAALGTVGQWVKLINNNVAGNPPARQRMGITYQSNISRILLSDGGTGTISTPTVGTADVWTFVSSIWTQVTAAASSTNNPPPAVWGTALADIPDYFYALQFGGWTGAPVDSTYAYALPPAVAVHNDRGEVAVGQPVKFYANVTGGTGAYLYAWSGLPSGCITANVSLLSCTPNSGAGGIRYGSIHPTVVSHGVSAVLMVTGFLMVDAQSQRNATLVRGPLVANELVGNAFWSTRLKLNGPVNSTLSALMNATPFIYWRVGAGEDSSNLSNGCFYNQFGNCGPLLFSPTTFITMCHWMAVCRSIFTVPAMTNDTGLAVATVKYVQNTLGYRPDYWAIGNEPNNWQHFNKPFASWTPGDNVVPTSIQFANEVKRFVTALRAFDPTIKIIGDEQGVGNQGLEDYILNVSKVNKMTINALALHDYPAGAGSPLGVTYSKFLDKVGTSLMQSRIDQFRDNESRGCPTCKYPTFINEFNSASGTPDNYATYQQHFVNVPFITAGVLESLRQNVSMYTFFDFYNFYPYSLIENTTLTPTYLLFSKILTQFPIGQIFNDTTSISTKSAWNYFTLESVFGGVDSLLVDNANTSVTLNISLGSTAMSAYVATHPVRVVTFFNPGVVTITPYAAGAAPTSFLIPPLGVVLITNGTPTSPTGLSLSFVTQTSMTLTWTNPAGALVNSTVYRWTSSTCSGTATSTNLLTPHTSNVQSPLLSATTYSFEVSAWGAGGSSPPSSCVTGTTLPSSGSGLSITSVTQTTIALAWTNPGGTIVNDTVYRWTGLVCSGTVTATSLGAAGTSNSQTGLLSLTHYSFEFAAWTISGSSAPSSCVTGETLAPFPPSGFFFTVVTPTSISMAWTNPPGPIANDTIYQWPGATCSGNATSTSTGPGHTTNTQSGLASATQYAFEVSDWVAGGSSPPSTCITWTTLPTVTTGLSVTFVAPTYIGLSWSNPSGTIVNDTIYRWTGANCSGTVNTTSIGLAAVTATQTSLNFSTQYSFEIQAWSAGGPSAVSTCVTGLTLPAPPPLSGSGGSSGSGGVPSPTNLTVVSVTDTTVTLAWNDSGNTDHYIVRYGTSCDGLGNSSVTTTNPTTVYGLSPSTLYCFQVTAVSVSGQSGTTPLATAETSASGFPLLNLHLPPLHFDVTTVGYLLGGIVVTGVGKNTYRWSRLLGTTFLLVGAALFVLTLLLVI